MGLDMYLHKKVYQYRKPDGTLTSDMSAVTFDDYGRSNGTYVVTQAAYWRKANQIHKWFVDNVCEGNDDCKPYYCGRDKIEELVGVCREVLGVLDGAVFDVDKEKVGDNSEGKEPHSTKFDMANLEKTYSSLEYYHVIADADVAKRFAECASNLLPTQEGFFFGETSYGIGYIFDLIKTVLMLEGVLADEEVADYEYEASW